MSGLTKVLIGAAAFVVLYFITNAVKHDPIEEDLLAKAESALPAAAKDWAEVRIDGRRATVSGTPPSKEAGAKVVDIIGDLRGINRARGDFAALESVSPYLWVTTSRAESITLSGVAPSQDAINALMKSAKATFSGKTVFNQMRVADGVPSGDWQGVAMLGIGQLGALDTGSAKLQDTALTVTGVTKSPTVAANVKAAILAAAKGFTASDDITVDLPPVEPAPIVVADAAADEPKAVIVPQEAQQEIDQCQSRIDTIMTGQTIEFRTGSAEVFPQPNPLIIALADVAKDCPSSRIEISGHTDSVGDAQSNQTLSEARARAIVNLLIDQSVPEARLASQGFGPSQPIADNSTPEGRSANRRIEFKVLYAGGR